jgi:cell division inhibitor SulA/protein ImuA
VSDPLERSCGQGLDAVLAATPFLWKGRQTNHRQAVLPTGHARLDSFLPGGGWPRGAVTELITAHPGLGEFSLLFPALAAAGAQGRWLLLIDPPWIPYPAALHGQGLCLERLLLVRTAGQDESLWACEQALRSIPEGIVLLWPRDIRFAALRRLQLAAESHCATAFLFRPEATAATASPAALRLRLDDAMGTSRIEILKCRGPKPAQALLLQPSYCSPRECHERIPNLVGDPVATVGAGLPYPRLPQASQPHRHH